LLLPEKGHPGLLTVRGGAGIVGKSTPSNSGARKGRKKRKKRRVLASALMSALACRAGGSGGRRERAYTKREVKYRYSKQKGKRGKKKGSLLHKQRKPPCGRCICREMLRRRGSLLEERGKKKDPPRENQSCIRGPRLENQ